jgi:hypothetical protein
MPLAAKTKSSQSGARLKGLLHDGAGGRCRRIDGGHVFGLSISQRKLAGMKPLLACAIALIAFTPIHPAFADPIHAVGNGDYWHHDSGWVFPERVGEFVRIGFPQDVAGSRDAVGYYERVFNGVKVVVDVDIFPVDSAAENVTFETARASLVAAANGKPGELSEGTLAVDLGLQVDRVRFTPSADAPAQSLYFAVAGGWRVRIRVSIPPSAREVVNELDSFVQQQRWEKLAG